MDSTKDIENKLLECGLSETEISNLLSPINEELSRRVCGLVWKNMNTTIPKDYDKTLPYFEPIQNKVINNNSATNNLIIEGDNLYALLAMQYTHINEYGEGLVDVIYIDPPYNTGSTDFSYNDRYETSEWLSLMNIRLRLAKNLMKQDAIIYISIDEHYYAQLKLLCDDIWGFDKFVGNIVWEKRTKCQNTKTAKYMLQSKTESILVYKNKKEKYEFCLEFVSKRIYNKTDEKGEKYRLEQIGEMSIEGMRGRETMNFEYYGIKPKKGNQWKYGIETFQKFDARKDLVKKGKKLYFRVRPYDEEDKYNPFWSFYSKNIGTAESGKNEISKILNTKKHGFETVKPTELIKSLLSHVIQKNKNAIVLDFFAGSGTTGQAVMELNAEDKGNRRFILCNNNEGKGKNKGICTSILYPRISTIIKGIRNDSSKYSDGLLNNNLFYFQIKTDLKNRETKEETIRATISKFVPYICIKENIYNITESTNYYYLMDNKIDIYIFKDYTISYYEDAKKNIVFPKNKKLKIYCNIISEKEIDNIRFVPYPKEIMDCIEKYKIEGEII